MAAFILRLMCLCAGLGLALYGIDGLRINTVPKTLTIEEIEQHGVGDARYINVVGGQSDGSYVVNETLKDKHVMDVIYPVLSRARLANASSAVRPPVSLVFKTARTLDCKFTKDTDCGQVGPIQVAGVVQGGPVWWLRDLNSHSLETIKYPMARPFFFVDEGPPSPAPVYLIFTLAGAILFSLGLLKKESFRRYVLGRR